MKLPKEKPEPMSPGLILGLSIAGYILAIVLLIGVTHSVLTNSARGTAGGLGAIVMSIYYASMGIKKYRQAKLGKTE